MEYTAGAAGDTPVSAVDVDEADRRIRPRVAETPYRQSDGWSAAAGIEVWLKEEQHLPTGSFKLRGAVNKLLTLSAAARAAGIVAASSGNHGAAVAYAASAMGVRARVYVPEGASPAKVDKIRAKGAEIVLFGTDGLDTELEARAAAARTGAAYVSPYNDPAVMAGQGTAAVEMLRQGPVPDTIYIAVGGGGLIGGMALWLRAMAPQVRIVGALPANSPVMAESVRAGRIVEMVSEPTLSDGTAGGIEAGAITFPVCRDLVHEWVTVTEDEIAAAMRQWAQVEPGRIEGAAGVALAAMWRDAPKLNGQRVAVVVCGGNIAGEAWGRVVGDRR
ncbi:MAG: threonine/serine dehydratase [Gemmatimonadetes bacterium]|nr:threonine/serine dehydratase [Gemmatimonadota bacterium]